MKKTLTIITFIVSFSFNLCAQADKESGDNNSYCAQQGVNQIVVIYQGAAIVEDVKLENGTIVKPDATVILKDGTKTLLREGRCINRDGNMPNSNE